MTRKGVWALLSIIALALSAQGVRAGSMTSETVLYSGSEMVVGSDPSLTTLSVPSAGELFVTLSDLDFPDPFASLLFAVTSSTSAMVGLADAGTLTLNLTGPTTLYAEVFPTAQGPMDAGLYNLTATFLSSAPVPLPSSGALTLAVVLLVVLGEAIRRVRARAQKPVVNQCMHITVTTSMA